MSASETPTGGSGDNIVDILLSPDSDAPIFPSQADQAVNLVAGGQLEMASDGSSLKESGMKPTNASMLSLRSMENILLDSSPMEESIDLGNISRLEAATSVEVPEMEAEAPPISLDQGETDHQGTLNPITDLEKELQELGIDTNTDISKYFASPMTLSGTAGDTDSGNEFFDTLSSLQSESLGEDSLPVVSEETKTDQDKVIFVRQRSSTSTEEAQPVAFEEDKGEGVLRPTPSTRSLTKFFADSGGSVGADSDGRAFFETFTAGDEEAGKIRKERISQTSQGESHHGLTNPMLAEARMSDTTTASGQGVLEVSAPIATPIPMPTASTLIPPETPPIPQGSPLTSPFRTSLSSPPASPNSSMNASPRDRTFSAEEAALAHSISAEAGGLVVDQVMGAAPFHADGEDPFTVGLNMSDLDRRHDAWIPSEMTRQALIAMMTSTPGSVAPQSDQLTMPGILLEEPQGDPVRDLVRKFMGDAEANKRSTLTADNVPQDETGLRQLIKAECLRAAIDLSGKLLTQCGQGPGKLNIPTKHTPYTLQLWFCRISLLLKLRDYSNADSECQAFGSVDKPDLYFEYYPDKYPGRRGSMVPFDFRVLHAELPQHIGKSQESLDRLYYLLAIVQKIQGNLAAGLAEDGSMLLIADSSRKASRDLWEAREMHLLHAIGNCLLNNKDFGCAVEVYEGLLKRDAANRLNLLCGLGRIYLQIGDVHMAERYFSQAEKGMDLTTAKDKCSSLMNKAFLAMGQNHFADAYNYFKQAVQVDPSNAVATNNMAVCSLYMCELKEALTSLETLVHREPSQLLQDGVLFNLCTLYELESSRAMHKKQALLELVSRHKGNSFNVHCLKMS